MAKHRQLPQRKHLIIFSLLIAIIIFSIFGIHTHWWFNGDDFHALYLAYKTKTWTQFFHFFVDGHVNQDCGPTNCLVRNAPVVFLSAYYRPLWLMLFTILYWLFGTHAYWYFLINIIFHTLNSILLFRISLYFVRIIPALLATFFFAFHPQIAYRFGAAVNLQYYINTTLGLCIVLLFKRYLDTQRRWFYYLAGILFACSLLLRETMIVLPAILLVGAFLYEQSTHSLNLFFTNGYHYLKKTILFWCIALGYLLLRLYLYPLSFTFQHGVPGGPTLQAIISRKTQEFLVFFYDALGLSWLPWGNKTLKLILIIPLCSLLCWLFFKNKNKIYVLFFALCTALIMWPAYIGFYSPRYIYEALPVIILMYLCCGAFYHGKLVRYTSLFTMIAIIPTLFYLLFTHESLARRETKLHTLETAVHELVSLPTIKNRALCIMGYPVDGFGEQNADLFWMLLDNPDLPVFFDPVTGIMQADSNLVTPTRWKNIVSEYFDKNYISITPVNGGFRFISHNPNKVFFNIPEAESSYSLGEKIINRTEKIKGINIVTDFTLLIQPQYLTQKPLFFMWDYAKKKFVLLEN